MNEYCEFDLLIEIDKSIIIRNELKKEKLLIENSDIENSDIEIIDEMFNKNNTHIKKNIEYEELNKENLDTIILKNKKDHEDFGLLCSNKLKKSTSLYIKSFYNKLNYNICNNISINHINEIIKDLQKIIEIKNKK
jgi:hypothetical protein